MPLGLFVRVDESAVLYETPFHSYQLAPIDCVEVRAVEFFEQRAPHPGTVELDGDDSAGTPGHNLRVSE